MKGVCLLRFMRSKTCERNECNKNEESFESFSQFFHDKATPTLYNKLLVVYVVNDGLLNDLLERKQLLKGKRHRLVGLLSVYYIDKQLKRRIIGEVRKYSVPISIFDDCADGE